MEYSAAYGLRRRRVMQSLLLAPWGCIKLGKTSRKLKINLGCHVATIAGGPGDPLNLACQDLRTAAMINRPHLLFTISPFPANGREALNNFSRFRYAWFGNTIKTGHFW